MVAGGVKFKNQRFNATAAGVSSVLLIVAIIGTPLCRVCEAGVVC